LLENPQETAGFLGFLPSYNIYYIAYNSTVIYNIIGIIMKQKLDLHLSSQNALRKLGQDISEARRRRRITVALMAERAGVSPITVKQIEQGNPSTSIGGYASILFILGMTESLSDIADIRHDLTGQRLAEESLPKRIYYNRKRTKNG
jgi:transcriptional regulator with XRE-family HTH domain